MVTKQQNCKKAAKERDCTFAKHNHQNKKCVKVTNYATKEVTYPGPSQLSKWQTEKRLEVNKGLTGLTGLPLFRDVNDCVL